LIKKSRRVPDLIPVDAAKALVVLGYGPIWSGARPVSPLSTCESRSANFQYCNFRDFSHKPARRFEGLAKPEKQILSATQTSVLRVLIRIIR
jgi:hypothetical protein